MGFGKKKTVILTREQKVARYWAMAESEFNRSGKAGRLEAANLHATRSVAAANLALGLSNGSFDSADVLDDDDEMADG